MSLRDRKTYSSDLPKVAAFSAEDGAYTRELTVELKLGSPRHNCQKTGICAIHEVAEHTVPSPKGKIIGKISFQESRSQISLKFLHEYISEALLDKHFSDAYFQIMAALPLPEKICYRLGVPGGATLKAGKYELISRETYYKIQVNLLFQ